MTSLPPHTSVTQVQTFQSGRAEPSVQSPVSFPESNSASAPSVESPPTLDSSQAQGHAILEALWPDFEARLTREPIYLPDHIYWLNGAPGSGKGTHTRFMLQQKGWATEPVVVGQLLNSPEAREKMNRGLLVGDLEVTQLVFEQLLKQERKGGMVVDGYPRTHAQAACLKAFHEKMRELVARLTPSRPRLVCPQFHIWVLLVNEHQSVERQLKRGQKTLAHNEQVKRLGAGEAREARLTDLSEECARKRYQVFLNQSYDALQGLRGHFNYYAINTHGSIEEVQERLKKALRGA